MEDLKYPVGKFGAAEFNREACVGWIDDLAALPGSLEAALVGWDESKLDTPYRPDGWTVRQLVHHVADSHMNAFIRFRLALTEETPVVKTYQQDRWAELPDCTSAPAEVSLRLVRALHERWVALLRALPIEDFDRSMQHPEWGTITLGFLLQIYAWHGRHHVAHIEGLRRRMGW